MKKNWLDKAKCLDDFFSEDSWLALMYRILYRMVNYGLFLLIPIWFGIAELDVFGLVLAWISSLSALCLLGFNVVLLKGVLQYRFTAEATFLYRKIL